MNKTEYAILAPGADFRLQYSNHLWASYFAMRGDRSVTTYGKSPDEAVERLLDAVSDDPLMMGAINGLLFLSEERCKT